MIRLTHVEQTGERQVTATYEVKEKSPPPPSVMRTSPAVGSIVMNLSPDKITATLSVEVTEDSANPHEALRKLHDATIELKRAFQERSDKVTGGLTIPLA